MKKLALLLGFIVCVNIAGVVLFSCKKNTCGSKSQHVHLDSIKAVTYRIHGYNHASNTLPYGLDLTAYQGNKLGFDSIGIQIDVNSSLTQFEVPASNGSFINYAQACDPAFTSDQIEKVVITSNIDYSDGFLAGADLKPIMGVYLYDDYNYAAGPKRIDDVVLRKGLFNVIYRFTTPPSSEKTMDLTFRYELSNDRVYVTTVKNIHLY